VVEVVVKVVVEVELVVLENQNQELIVIQHLL
jgi:hypothetical protein